MSYDLSKLVAMLPECWHDAARLVELHAETFANANPVPVDLNDLLSPYSPLSLALFSPLADLLTPDALDRLQAAVADYDAAWKTFYTIIQRCYPSLASNCERIEHGRRELQNIVADIYLGECRPELSPRYTDAEHKLRQELHSLYSAMSVLPNEMEERS